MVNVLLWVSTKQRSGRIDSGKAAAVAFAIGFLQWVNTIRKNPGATAIGGTIRTCSVL